MSDEKEVQKISASEPETLTKHDINKTWFRWWLMAEVSNNFERMQGLSWGAAISPVLKKLYKDPKDFKAALKRNIIFFNTEAIWGGLILGSTVALEEQKAKSPEMDADLVTSYKTGLMGPVAGLGDTIDWSTIYTLILAAASAIAAKGSWLAAVMVMVAGVLMYMEGLFFTRIGYTQGRKSIMSILKSGMINQALEFANILALMMIGSMTASLVTLKLTIKTQSVNVQKILDNAFPGILVLLAFFGIYWAMKKKKISAPIMIVIVMALCIVGAFFNIV
ncbi:MAG: PTS system mannose/fructose/sorbose family transporter subunit IID [Lactobacillus sp.]|jgi:D-glucosaminate-specific PTS system IID component|nr:PTS system mannose/fructose/sorbose family transporter subunit IID [Lactobacillus sp.]MCI2032338.1 PTS system mannose/fructose/sorbose family transporter subunit IID [Lactobacillus sp.]